MNIFTNIYVDVLLRVLFALTTGGLIGWERKNKGKPVGIITNILVCLGATVLAIYQQLLHTGIEIHGFSLLIANNYSSNEGRIVAQIVSGIGFLGAGTIMRDKNSVSGITTAATLWIMACLGIVIGSGYWFLSLVSVISVVFTLFFLKYFVNRVIDHKRLVNIQITSDGMLDPRDIFNEFGLSFNKQRIVKIEREEGRFVKTFVIQLFIPKYIDIDKMIKTLLERDSVYKCVVIL